MRATAYDSDDLLIAAFQEGKQDAFTVVYNRFQSGLYHFACRFVSPEDAYDAVAEAFVWLWQQKENFDALPKIEHWLFVTVRYTCLAQLRQQVRVHAAKTELLFQLEQTELSAVDAEALSTSLVQLLHREIDRLPARQKEVFLLSFEEGLSTAAIAEKLALSVKTIRNQKISAIRLLQSVLGSKAVFLTLLVLLHEMQSSDIPA